MLLDGNYRIKELWLLRKLSHDECAHKVSLLSSSKFASCDSWYWNELTTPVTVTRPPKGAQMVVRCTTPANFRRSALQMPCHGERPTTLTSKVLVRVQMLKPPPQDSNFDPKSFASEPDVKPSSIEDLRCGRLH